MATLHAPWFAARRFGRGIRACSQLRPAERYRLFVYTKCALYYRPYVHNNGRCGLVMAVKGIVAAVVVFAILLFFMRPDKSVPSSACSVVLFNGGFIGLR